MTAPDWKSFGPDGCARREYRGFVLRVMLEPSQQSARYFGLAEYVVGDRRVCLARLRVPGPNGMNYVEPERCKAALIDAVNEYWEETHGPKQE